MYLLTRSTLHPYYTKFEASGPYIFHEIIDAFYDTPL